MASSKAAGAALLAILAVALPRPAPAAHPEALRGRGGAVATEGREATDAGLAALGRGGNAVDAAVAAALVLAVVHPEAGNLGGGGFAVLRMGGEVATLDFRETAPAAARPDMYLGADGEPTREATLAGPLAAGVPGSPAGLHALHTRFGALPWREVAAAAVAAAEAGFPLSTRLWRAIDEKRELLARTPEAAARWLPGGAPPPVGTLVRQPELATTLRRYAEHGPEGITTGPIAAAVAAAARDHGGILTEGDLAAYRPVWRRPLAFERFGWTIATMDLPSSGGIVLGETLGILERLAWSDLPRFGADRAHLLAEAWRRANAERVLLGDPATSRATAAEILESAWLDRRAAEIDRAAATPSAGILPRPVAAAAEGDATTHVAATDAAGNLVSLTTTLNGLFGCGLLVPGAGFFLNNEMDDFAVAPGRPNAFGLVQGEANAIRPGKRMLSSMTPLLAWRDGEAFALGGRGGSRIPTGAAQVFLNLVADGDDLQAAVERARIHHQWLPDELVAEPDALSPETRAALERRGHHVVIWAEPGPMSSFQAVRWSRGGAVAAAADPRRRGVAGVVEVEP